MSRGAALGRVIRRAIGLAAALTAACAGTERKPPETPAAAQSAVPAPSVPVPRPAPTFSPTDSARFFYWSFAGGFDATRAQLVARLGAPASTTRDTLRNEHDPGVVDTLVTLGYPGLSVRYFVGSRGNEFPTAVSVTDSAIVLPLPVGIGARRAALERYFGAPDDERYRRDSVLVGFAVPSVGISPGDNELVFVFVGSTVRRIDWVYYVD